MKFHYVKLSKEGSDKEIGWLVKLYSFLTMWFNYGTPYMLWRFIEKRILYVLKNEISTFMAMFLCKRGGGGKY